MKTNRSFWKVAGLLTTAHILTGLCILFISYQFTDELNARYSANLIRDYVDHVSMEIEQRSFIDTMDEEVSLSDISERLLLDLSARSPDPIHLLTADGESIMTIQPNTALFARVKSVPIASDVPDEIHKILALPHPEPVVHIDRDGANSWAVAPVFNAGQLVGGVMVQPLTNTLSAETARVETPFLWIALLLLAISLVMGISLSYLITYRLKAS